MEVEKKILLLLSEIQYMRGKYVQKSQSFATFYSKDKYSLVTSYQAAITYFLGGFPLYILSYVNGPEKAPLRRKEEE